MTRLTEPLRWTRLSVVSLSLVFLLGAAVFTRFRFDHAEHARVRAELEQRRGETP